jgi:hypothetical protein
MRRWSYTPQPSSSPALAEHIGEHDHARATVNSGDGGNDIIAPLFDIVIRTDGDRLDQFLRTDHMFQRSAKFRREAAVGQEDDSNHRTYLFVGELRACMHTKAGDIGPSRAGQSRFCSRREIHDSTRIPQIGGS